MSKVLFISNMAKKVGSFSVASIEAAKKCGLEFYFAANWSEASDRQIESDEKKYGIKLININLERSPWAVQNIKAYKQLVNFIKEEQIDYIHCNTPVGGILGRLAGARCNVKKVLYQVHGFHFYDGAPKKNWLMYYPVEKWLARKTDAIITINKEDFERAKKFKLRNNGQVYYVPGVGMDLAQYNLSGEIRKIKREELGLDNGDIALISMGDLIPRKNYSVAIRAIAKINDSRLHYYICGKGPDEEKLKLLAKKSGIDKQVHFLGYRTDIKELLRAADIFLFTSKQEGLARSLMEAMASGLPCVASNIRGNTDLLEGNEGGYLCDSEDDYVNAIKALADEKIRNLFGKNNLKTIVDYDLQSVVVAMEKTYTAVLGDI